MILIDSEVCLEGKNKAHNIFAFHCRVAVLFAFLWIVPLVACDRLSLTKGAYARVVSLQEYPLSSFTVSGWVNVTRFSEGISPLITYLSEDVTSQFAFFLHPKGVGVLWGGPSGEIVEETEGLPLVDRQPRAKWVETKLERRKKREAVDYSGGLGDIENILTKRSGTVGDTWAPLNFVDVGEMGVADLMLSGSENVENMPDSDDSHPQSRVYSDWTNVPYELHMEETVDGRGEYVVAPIKGVASRQEPSIITQPSGNDDFVYFNWNVPNGRDQGNIPLGNNNWSPVWESTKQNVNVNQLQNPIKDEKPINHITTQPKRKQTWAVSHESHQGGNLPKKWDSVSLNADIYESRPLETKLLPTKVERPIWPSSYTVPQRERNPGQITLTQKNNVHSIFKPQVPQSSSNNFKAFKIRTDQDKDKIRPPPLLPPLPPPSIQKVKKPTTLHTTSTQAVKTTTTTTTPATTTTSTTKTTSSSTPHPRRNIIPTLYRYTKKRKNVFTTAKPQVPEMKELEVQEPKGSVVPLWERIKKTQNEEDSELQNQRETGINNPIYSIPAYTKHSRYTTTERIPFKTIHSFPEPTLPPIKPTKKEESLQALGSVRRNIYYRSRPVQIPSIARRPITTTTRTTSMAPPTSKKNYHQPTPITHKVPNYQGYKPESSTVQAKESFSHVEKSNNRQKPETKQKQSISNYQLNKYAYAKVNEFEKAMRDPQLIKEGNTAIVYAVPITNEKEFYEMYKKYQRDSVKPRSSMNLHDLYNEMRTGGIDSETEIDANGIKSTQISLFNSNNYQVNNKYSLAAQNTPLSTTTLASTPTTTEVSIVKEITTAPQRSDVPIQIDNEHKSKITSTEKDYPHSLIENPNYDYYTYDEVTEFPQNDNEVTYDYYDTDDETKSTSSKAQKPLPEESQKDNIYSETNDTNHYVLPQLKLNDQTVLADLYRPKEPIPVNIPEIASQSHYQEQQALYLDQLPPQYLKPEKQYDFQKEQISTTPAEEEEVVSTSEPPSLQKDVKPHPIYSSNPLDLLSQGLVPKPIHMFETHAEADEWMRRQHDSSPFLLAEGQQSGPIVIPPNSLPSPLPQPNQQPSPLSEITQLANPSILESDKLPLDIHFEKVAYTFSENQWYHLALTWNAQTKRATVYVNGERIGIIENVLQGQANLKEGGLFLLGKTLLPDLSNFDENSQFIGEMSDLNMWATELDPPTVDAVFQCKYDPVFPQPIDWGYTELKLYDNAAITSSPPLCGLVT